MRPNFYSHHVTPHSFNSRTPCGVRPVCRQAVRNALEVSIHAPRVGCDRWTPRYKPSTTLFQFTHPVWGATRQVTDDPLLASVSIHAPRVGCDCPLRRVMRLAWCFNSRTPCGVRLRLHDGVDGGLWCIAKLIPSIWCDYVCMTEWMAGESFNSRTPCGVRPRWRVYGRCPMCFNSRTPCGVRPVRRCWSSFFSWFQFTHPVWGATPLVLPLVVILRVSIHAPRVGCDFSIAI